MMHLSAAETWRRILCLVVWSCCIGALAGGAQGAIQITSGLTIDSSNTVQILKNVGETATAAFHADGEDAPAPNQEHSYLFNHYTWAITPTGASISPTAGADTTFTAQSTTPLRRTYTLTVTAFYNAYDQHDQVVASDVPGGSKSVLIDMSFVQPGLLISANSNWENVDGRTITLLKGTKYTFKFTLNVTPPLPVAGTSWSGIKSGSGETIEIIFNSDLSAQTETAALGAATKTVTINVVTPLIGETTFVGNGQYDLWDVPNTCKFPYAGFRSDPPLTMRNPISLKQGSRPTIHLELRYPIDLTYDVPQAVVWALDDPSSTELVGGGYVKSSCSFTKGPRSGLVEMAASQPIPLMITHGIAEIGWQYRIPWGNNQWIDVGSADYLSCAVIYDAPKYGNFAGCKNPPGVQPQDFVFGWVAESIDQATSGLTQPVSQANIAERMVVNRGWAGVGREGNWFDVHGAWDDFHRREFVGCIYQAHGLAYGLRWLGVDAKIAYANLDAAVNWTATYSTGQAVGVIDGYTYRYRGDSSWLINPSEAFNEFEACVYLQATGATTTCYDSPNGKTNLYWKLGNDMDIPGPSGKGELFRYKWVATVTIQGLATQSVVGTKDSNGVWWDSKGGAMTILTPPSGGN